MTGKRERGPACSTGVVLRLLLIAALLVGAQASCASKSPPENATRKTPPPQVEDKESPAPVGGTAGGTYRKLDSGLPNALPLSIGKPATGAGFSKSEIGLGLDVLLNRAVSDSWVLSSRMEFARRQIPLQEQMQLAVAMAKDVPRDGEVEVPVDTDEDGSTDAWVYFVDDVPVCVEADQFCTGSRNVRMELAEDDQPTIHVTQGWFLEPPVPLPLPECPPLAVADVFDHAFAAENPAQVQTPYRQLAAELLPDLADELGIIAGGATDSAAEAELSEHQSRARELLP